MKARRSSLPRSSTLPAVSSRLVLAAAMTPTQQALQPPAPVNHQRANDEEHSAQ